MRMFADIDKKTANKMVTFERQEGLMPICHYCEESLERVLVRTCNNGAWTGRTKVYFCGACHKVLGFSECNSP